MFVPAHVDSRAGAVQERLGRSWSEGFGLAVLLIDLEPWTGAAEGGSRIVRDGSLDRFTFRGTDVHAIRNLIASVEWTYEVVCVNLTGAPEPVATAILNLAHSIFLVSDSARPSLERSRAVVEKLRRLGLEDRTALLLRRTPGGVRADLAEDLAGVPVCGMVESPEQVERLARWLAQPQPAFAQTA